MIGKLKSRSGFTLIELLVVIAIIAILAAILFPVFAQAREKARQSGCASNAKQIGTAFMMYAQDFDETEPPAYLVNATQAPLPAATATQLTGIAPNIAWTNLAGTGPIDGYLKNQKVKECPSGSGGSPRLDYLMNQYLGSTATAQMASPSDCILVVDLAWPAPTAGQSYCAASSASPIPVPAAGVTSGAPARHSGQTQATCAFADGHVKSFKREKVWPITLYVVATNAGTGNMWAPLATGTSGTPGTAAADFPTMPR